MFEQDTEHGFGKLMFHNASIALHFHSFVTISVRFLVERIKCNGAINIDEGGSRDDVRAISYRSTQYLLWKKESATRNLRIEFYERNVGGETIIYNWYMNILEFQ